MSRLLAARGTAGRRFLSPLGNFAHVPVLIVHHAALVVEGVHTAVLVIVVDGGKRVIVAHAVQTMGVIVVMRGSTLRQSVLGPALRMGGEVAAVVGEGFGKPTLHVGQPSAKPVVDVGAFPVVGHAAANIRVVADMVIDEMHVGLAGSLHRPRPAEKG